MIRRAIAPLALLFALAPPAVAHADFGFAGKGSAVPLNAKGGIERRAGAHPYSFTVHFELKTDSEGVTEGGQMRDLLIDVPPGLVGNPEAIPACPRQSFEGGVPECKPGTQVGVLQAVVAGLGKVIGPIYNLAPPPAAPVQFGFESGGFQVLQTASVRTEEGYGVTIAAPNLPLEAIEATATIWGTPADPRHTTERGPVTPGNTPSEAPLVPFLTLPGAAGADA